MDGPWPQLRSVTLQLTAQCNLRCAYCYQNAKSAERMDWHTARAAVDLAWRFAASSLEISFTGGEPLLEADLLRRVLGYAESNRPDKKGLAFSLLTNGMLLDDRTLDLVEEHDVELHLSFDGVRAAQRQRGPDTFEALDARLDRMRSREHLWEEKLTVATTVSPHAVGHLADSVDYFLARDLRRLAIAPAWVPEVNTSERSNAASKSRGGAPETRSPAAEYEAELERQFARVLEASREHFLRTRHVPVQLLRPRSKLWWSPRAQARACAAAQAEHLVVGVDGTIVACGALIPSGQRFSPRVQAVLSRLPLGSVLDPGFADRWTERWLVYREEAPTLFLPHPERASGHGRCADCELIERCSVCTASLLQANDDADLGRVPDTLCAFARISARARDRFAGWHRRETGQHEPNAGSAWLQLAGRMLERSRTPRP